MKVGNRYFIPLIFCVILVLVTFALERFEVIETILFQGVLITATMFYVLYVVLVTLLKLFIKKDFFTGTIAFGLALFLVGQLYRLMHWPGGKIMVLIGIVVTVLFALIMFWQGRKEKANLN